MMQRNPYVLTFGKEPVQHIERISEKQLILDNFLSPDAAWQIFLITGVRGSGKTVFMTDVSDAVAAHKEWVIVDLNADSEDLMREAAAILSSNNEFARIFQSAKLNFSLFGFGLEVNTSVPISDMQTALEKMIVSLAGKKKKILFTIDEVTGTPQIRSFTSAFQQFLRKKLPVYLLMTGLYKNIFDLQNNNSLTFLYRAPKLSLSPLNIGAMAGNYEMNLNVTKDTALNMAKLTKGYSFAFQLLGYLTYRSGGNYRTLIPQFRQYLEEMSYEKIWDELSVKDKEVMTALALTEDGKNTFVMKKAGMTQNEFNPYRRRLIRSGVVDGSRRGYLEFTLPFFREFILDNR